MQLLRDNNLEAPDVFKLFQVLTCFGYDCEKLPLSINEAIDELTKTIEGGKGRVHLDINEHTHRDVNECLNNYNHQ